MRRAAAWATALLLLVPAVAACSSSDHTTSPGTSAPTPLTRLDVGSVRVARAEFCDQMAAAEVRRALGGAPDAHQTWGNGDPVPSEAASPGAASGSSSGDVGHELGCAWTTTAGAAARAWVFARPVTADLADALVTQAGRDPGCTASRAPVLGRPALLQTCSRPGGVERVRRAGLLGDTWLTCELAGPAATHPRARLDAWCAAVVASLRTS